MRQRSTEVASLRQTLGVDDGSVLPEPIPVPPLPAVGFGGDEARACRRSMPIRVIGASPPTNASARSRRWMRSPPRAAASAPRCRLLAGKRVAIAEQAAAAEALRRQADDLDRQRSGLMVEASRQDAERARGSRTPAAGSADAGGGSRARAAADAEAQARQSAEAVVQGVGDAERAKLKAARDREAELARQEAELAPPRARIRQSPRKSPSTDRFVKK